MRIWLTFLIVTAVATAGISVYLVQHPPVAATRTDPEAEAAPPEDDAGTPVGKVRAQTPPAPPTPGLEPGIVPDDDAAAEAEGNAAPEDDPEGDGTGDEPPFGTLPDGDEEDEGNDEDEEDRDGDADSGSKKSSPPVKPTPWTREWTRNFKEGPAVIPVDVVFGYAQLNLTVLFTPTGLAPVGVGTGEVQLTWTEAPLPKITCKVPVPLTGPSTCGPLTTPATEGAWEVTFLGSGDVEAKVTLSSWIEP